jgi:hypothetical protein
VGSNGSGSYTYVLNEDLANVTGNATGVYTGLSSGSYTVTITDSNGCDATTTTITLTDPVVLSNTTTADVTLLCNGDSDGTGTFTVSGGTAPYTFTVDTNTTGGTIPAQGATTQDFTNAGAGIVTVTVTDVNGCFEQQTITITEPASIVAASIAGSTSICPGTNTNLTFTLSGNGANFDVIYTDGSSNILLTNVTTGQIVSVSPASTTTYTLVSVTDLSTSCNTATLSGSAVISVLSSPATDSNLAFNTTCSDDNIGITLLLEGGGSAFSWDIELISKDANVTGGSAIGVLAVGETDEDFISTHNYNNISSTSGQVVYRVIPNSSGGCSGSSFDVTVTINPEPDGVTATSTGCSDEVLSYNLQDNVNLGNSVLSTFSWIAADNANVVGESTSAQLGGIINDVITNDSGLDQDVVYTVTPTSANSCVGDPFTVTITINSEPTANDAVDAACSGVAASHNLQGDIVNGLASNFVWVAASNANVSGESTSTQTGGVITDVITNVTSINQTVVYTVTPTENTNNCSGNDFTVTVTVFPEPVGFAFNTSTCSDVVLAFDLQDNVNNVGNTVPSTFTWIANDNVNVIGESTTTQSTAFITDVLTNVTSSAQTVVYTATPTSVANTCLGAPFVITVTVDPEPVGVASVDNTCSGDPLSHSLQGDITNGLTSNFSWIAQANHTIVTGESFGAAVVSNTITDVLVNTSGADQVVVYDVTPTDNTNSCEGDVFTVSVTIESAPAASNVVDATCSDVALVHSLQGDITNAVTSSFSWIAAVNGSVAGESTSAQGGGTINDNLTNVTATNQTVVYTVTPTSPGGCVGPDFTVTVTVYPEPVASNAVEVVCSDVALAHSLQGDITNGLISGFSWVAADNGNVSGESLTPQAGGTINNTLTNLTGSDEVVVYTVTPTDNTNSCLGDVFTVTVTVYSEPVGTNSTDNTCSDVALSHSLQGDIANGITSTFTWIAADNGSTTGESTGLQATGTINDVINNPSGTQQTIVYTVTPTSNDGNSCAGDSFTVTVTVDPEPVGLADTDNECSDIALNYDLQNNVNTLGNSVVSTFSWIAADNTNVTGESTSAQAGSTINDVITNLSGSDQAVVYTVTPTSTTSSCLGDPFVITITIYSEPATSNVIDATCSDVALTHSLQGDISNGVISDFSWIAADNSNVSGESLVAQVGGTINDVLTNLTGSDELVVYTVTATDNTNSCVGNPFTVTVTVYSEPVGTNSVDATCSDVALSHSLQGDILNGITSTFTWIAADNGSTTGESTGLQASGTINDVINNPTNVQQTIVYTVTPTSNDGNGCLGDVFTVTVTVDPEPIGIADADTECSDVTLSYNLQNNIVSLGNSVVSTFSWVAASNGNVLGESTSAQAGSIINDMITNISGADEDVVYTVTPTSTTGSCAGDPFVVTITVYSEPDASNVVDATCSGLALSHGLQADITNGVTSNFVWIAASNANVSGESTSAQASGTITDVLTNVTGSDEVVVYTVTPTDNTNSCVGDPFTVSATVYSDPVGLSATDNTCSDVALNYDLQNNINTLGNAVASTFSWIAADNVNITGESTSAQGTAFITDVLNNLTSTSQSVVYTVSPTSTANSCLGNFYTITVTIDPEPVGVASVDNTCSGAALSHALQNDITNGLTSNFSWIAQADHPVVTGESFAAPVLTNTITDVLVNTSGSDQVIVYDVTPTDNINSCVGDVFTVSVTVESAPAASNGVDATCSDAILAHNLQGNITNGVISTFSWVAPVNGSVAGESITPQAGGTINDVLTNVTTTNQTVVYTVTPTSPGGCVGTDFTVTVTVYPEPVASNVVDAVCSDVALTHSLQGDITNGLTSNFSWVATDNGNVSGESLTPQAGGTINNTLTNLTGSDEIVVYTVTPTDDTNNCVGDPFTVTVTVHSEPVGTNAADNTCSDVALAHSLQGDIVNGITSTFTWIAADNGSTSGESTTLQTTATITDVINNSTSTQQTIVYTVTPTSNDGNSCAGDSFTVTVTVDPEPVGVTDTDNECSDVTISYDLQNNIVSLGNGVVSTFSWIAADNTNVTGESTSAQVGSTINDLITNTTGADEDVVYTVTPTSTTGTCAGDPFIITITIYSEPTASNVVDVTCSDFALAHNLQGDITNGLASNFVWVAASNTNVSGESTSTQTTVTITDVLTNLTGSDEIVVYTVTPTETTNNCAGDDFTVTVTVHSEPVGLSTVDNTCSDVALSHDLSTDITNGLASTFSWVASDNANIMGESITPQLSSTINDVLTNLSTISQVVSYTVTPTSNDGNSCVGSDFVITITVDPEPVGVASVDNVCSDVALSHVLQNDITNGLTSNFSWIAADNTNVSGESLTTQTTATIADVITNDTGSDQLVVYTVTPTDNTNSCVGDPFTVTVTVESEPTSGADTDAECSDVALSYDLQNNVNTLGNSVISTFSWVAAANANVSGESTSAQAGSIITDVITNISGSDEDVIYTITPSSTAGGCVGTPFIVTITIYSEPVGLNDADNTCSDVAFNYDLQNNINTLGNSVASTFSWVAADNTSVSGESTSAQLGSVINDNLTNLTAIQQTILYTVTPTSNDGNSCLGSDFVITVTIDPEPVGVASVDNVCSDVALAHSLQSDITNGLTSNFSWIAADNVNVTGESLTTQSTATITDVITNITGVDQVVVYSVTPTDNANSCIGDLFTVTVTVESEPTGDADTDMECSDIALNYDLQNNVNTLGNSVASTFSWVATPNGNVSGESTTPQVGSTINDVVTNLSGGDEDVIYTITPSSTSGGCVGTPFIVTITIYSEPLGVTAIANTCSDTAFNYDLQNNLNTLGNSVMSDYVWVATNNSNVSGESLTNQAGDVITDVLTNLTGVDQDVVYTITPTDETNSCVGDPFIVTVTVFSEPVGVSAVDATCSDVALAHSLQGDIVNGITSTFTWIAADNGSTTGESTVLQSTGTITDVINNPTSTQQIIVYTVTPTSNDGNGCVGDPFTVTVTVDPEPVGVADADTECSDIALSYDLQNNIVSLGNGIVSTFSWVAAANGNVTGESTTPQAGSTINDIITNVSGSDENVVYTVTPTSSTGGCIGNDFDITLTIYTESVGLNDTAATCSDIAFNYDLQNNVNTVGNSVSSNFLWVAASNSNIIGESVSPQAGALITDILDNQTNANQIVSYTVTPTDDTNGCVGDPFTIDVTVYPEPLGIDETINTCSDVILSYSLQNNVNTLGNNLSSTFTWVATNNPNVAGETTAAQATATINDVITNVTGLVQTVIYTVTPVSNDANTCTGDIFTITVTVDPEPVGVASIDNVCSDVALAHSLQGDITNGLTSSFSWIAADNTNVSGESLTTQTASIITDVITNVTGVDQVVVYTITPTDIGTSCIGDPFTVTVTVESEPTAAADTDTECSDVILSYDLQNNVDTFGNSVVSTFNWVATPNGNVTGESTSAQAGGIINDVVTNVSGADEDVVYTVTPSSSAGGCVGTPFVITITIYSEPVGINDTDDVCSDVAFNYDLQNNVNVLGNGMTSNFSWIAADNPNISGESLVAQGGSIISDVITNVSGADELIVYSITATDNTNTCVGDVFTVSITIHSEPLAVDVTDNTCSDVALAHNLQSDITNGMSSTFTWVAADNPSTTGESTGLQTTATITDIINNVSSIQQTVVYTITPTSNDANLCVGNTFTVMVTVDPEPVGVIDTGDGCSDVALDYSLQDNIVSLGNGVLSTYSWVAADNTFVIGESTSAQAGRTINDVVTNPSTIDQDVVYTITPTSLSIFGSCVGDPFTVTITIHPEPASVNVVDNTCSDVALSHSLQADITNGLTSTFLWIATGNANVSGESVVAQAGGTINNVLTNLTGVDQDVVYTVTPTETTNGCVGDPFIVTVTVYSEPVAPDVTDNTCSDVALSHSLQADITNGLTSSFSWIAADNINVAGESTTTQPTGTIADVITNLTSTTQTVVYTVTPTETTNSCVGDSFTVSVTVDPEPVGVASVDNVCSNDALAHNLQLDISNGLTSNFSWVAADNGNTTGESTGVQVGSIINDVITNPTNADEIILYTVTPTDNANGCVGDPFTVTVTVSPLPTMSIADNGGFTGTICSLSSTDFKLSTTTIGAIIRLDNIANTAGVTGFSTAGATFSDGNDIQDILTNATDNPVTITYEFSVTVGGCDDKVVAFTKDVTVNPNPSFTIANANSEICSGDAIGITLNSNTAGHQINLVAVNYGAVTGGSASGAFVNGNQITDALTNATNNPITVVYEFNVSTTTTPVCPLVTTSQFTTVVVNPDPDFTVLNNTSVICSGESTDIDITSPTTGAVIELINITSSSVDLIGIPATGSTYLNGANLTNTITNPTNQIQTVDYEFQVSIDGCIEPNTEVRRVTINPIPDVALSVSAQTICDNDFTDIEITNPNGVTGASYSWTVVATTGIGNATNDSGNAISQQLTNSTNTPGTATYTITPLANTCLGVSSIIIVTINPTPTLGTSGDQVICSGETTNVVLSNPNNVVGTTFSWSIENNSNNVSGATSGAGTTIAQDLLIDPNNGVGSVTYRITPSTDGCDGAFMDVVVTVNPIAIVNAGFDYEVCEDDIITLTTSLSGAASFATWTGGNNSTGYSNSGITVLDNEIITYQFDQVDINSGSVTFTLTSDDPDAIGGPCSVASDQITVIINELPIVSLDFAGLSVINQRVDTVAEADTPYLLIGSPLPSSGVNGTYSGDGVDGTSFNPAVANLNADNLVTYTYTDLKGCTNSVTDIIFVKAKPEIPPLSVRIVCLNNISIILDQLIVDEVGIWSGTGVTESGGLYTFSPSAAGLGNHVIRYDVVVNGSPGEAEQTFRVTPSPDVSFTVDNFCVEDEIQFESTSFITEDSNLPNPSETTNIIRYDWTYGDGRSSDPLVPLEDKPLHQYESAGEYLVTLKVTTLVEIGGNPYECSSSYSETIIIGAKPEASFTWDNSCQGEFAEFTSSTITSGSTISRFIWDFGDDNVISGAPSDIVAVAHSNGAVTQGTFGTPEHHYSTNGVFDVELRVETLLGCFDDFNELVGILPNGGSNFPYTEDFEDDNGGWVPGRDLTGVRDLTGNITNPVDTAWIWSELNGSNINDPGNNAWWTGKEIQKSGNPATSYAELASSYINGPCFDISPLTRPMISMDVWVDVQDGFDGAVLQYFSAAGEWKNVGFINQGLHWYDGQGIPGMANNQVLGRYGWTKPTNGWVSARFSLEHIDEVDRVAIRFRIAFGSDANTPEGVVNNGFAFDNVFIGNKTRNVLVEHFTNTYTNGDESNEYLYNTFNDQANTAGDSADFVMLQYHLGVPTSDLLYEDNEEDPGARALYYGFDIAPRSIMDGLSDFSGDTDSKITPVGIDSLALKDPLFTIRLDTVLTNRNVIGVNTSVSANKPFNGQLILHVAVVENEINLEGTIYRSVLKKMLYGADGFVLPDEAWDVDSDGQVYEINWDIDMTIYDPTKVSLVAFIQDKLTKEVYQAEYLKLMDKEQGAVTSILDEFDAAVKAMRLYPNPVRDQLTIVNTNDKFAEYYYEIVDQRGVKILSSNMSFTNGEYTINTSTIPNGVYYVVIGVENKPLIYRKIVVADRD